MTIVDLADQKDSVEATLARLTSAFASADVVRSVVAAHARQWHEIEAVAKDLLTKRWIDSATGEVLDRIGYLIGLERDLGETDDNYRSLLFIKLGINLSKGLPETVIDIVSRLSSGRVQLIELGNAMISLGAAFDEDHAQEGAADFLAQNISKITAAGIGIASFTIYPPSGSFYFGDIGDPPPDPVADFHHGFSQLSDISVAGRKTDDSGGKFAELFTRQIPSFEGSN